MFFADCQSSKTEQMHETWPADRCKGCYICGKQEATCTFAIYLIVGKQGHLWWEKTVNLFSPSAPPIKSWSTSCVCLHHAALINMYFDIKATGNATRYRTHHNMDFIQTSNHILRTLDAWILSACIEGTLQSSTAFSPEFIASLFVLRRDADDTAVASSMTPLVAQHG